MQETQNTKIVQDAYAAFGRGDVQGILNHLSDDVVWLGVYGAAAHVPTAGERRGKAAVGQFFGLVGENLRFSQFEPREFVASGDKVVALGSYAATTPSNKPFASDFAMVFTLKNGRITRFQEFCDSSAINAAFA